MSYRLSLKENNKMNALEKMKLNQALKKALDARNMALNALQKLKLSKEVQELRQQLGLVNKKSNPIADAEQVDIQSQSLEHTEESKQALRQQAFEYLKGLAKESKTVYCAALNADVHFSVSAAKKFTQCLQFKRQ